MSFSNIYKLLVGVVRGLEDKNGIDILNIYLRNDEIDEVIEKTKQNKNK